MAVWPPQTADQCREQGAPASRVLEVKSHPNPQPWELISDATIKPWQFFKHGTGFPLQLHGRLLYLRALGECCDRFIICWSSLSSHSKNCFPRVFKSGAGCRCSKPNPSTGRFHSLDGKAAPGSAFQEEWKKHMSQRPLISLLPPTPLCGCVCPFPTFWPWISAAPCWPQTWVCHCSLCYSRPHRCLHAGAEEATSSKPRVGTVP